MKTNIANELRFLTQADQKGQPRRSVVHNIPIPAAIVPISPIAPLPGMGDQRGLHGIVVDVAEGDRYLPEAVEDARMETISPEVALDASLLVIGASEDAEEPAHNGRKALMSARLYEEMDVIPHDTEIDDLKSVSSLRSCQDDEKKLTDGVMVEAELPIVDPGRDMIPGIFDENTWLAHTA